MERRRFVVLVSQAWFVWFAGLILARPSAGGQESIMTEERIRIFSVIEGDYIEVEKVILSDAEWRQRLTPEQYRVLREEGTDRAFTGALLDNKKHGIYRCAGCENDLYHSDHKYDSRSGWPSFYQAVAPENVATRVDRRLFMSRTEVLCRRCDGHLGHVFSDGPPPTGQRHCINSAALVFQEL